MNLIQRVVVACLLALPTVTVSAAATYYVHVPQITGQQSVPGFPNAMNVTSLKIEPLQFSFLKPIDGASPQLFQAVAQGTPLSATAFAYNGAPTPAPDALIPFAPNVFASSYQAVNGTDERVAFTTSNPGSLYLELPGIVGEHNTPGHPNIMKLNSVEFFANDFTIVRPIDSASPALLQAVAQGTQFPQARLLFYDAANPAGPPQQIWHFSTLLGSSYQAGGTVESVTLNFSSIPEPAGAAATVLIVSAATALRRSRQSLR